MADELISPDELSLELLPIHFDVPAHYVLLNTFKEAAQETEIVIASLNRRLFDGQLQYRVVVAPPKAGSLLTFLGIMVTALGAGTAATWAFLQTKPGEEFLRELTGHELKDLMGLAGRKFRERVMKKPPVAKPVEDNETPTVPEGEKIRAIEEQKLAASIVMIETTRAFLVADTDKLRKAGLRPQDLTDAFEARNALYQALSADKQVRAIGFDESDKFPVKRQDFARLQVSVDAKDEVPSLDHWTVDSVSVSVSSPNWDRGDSKRQWRGRESSGAWRNFQILDEGFWTRVANNDLILQGKDNMEVQWAYLGSGGHRKKYKVVKVLAYNGEKLAEPLDDNALEAILGSYARDGSAQKDLFGNS